MTLSTCPACELFTFTLYQYLHLPFSLRFLSDKVAILGLLVLISEGREK